ncbi:serine hydrolase domain-containing protein [Nocardia sp. NPDC051570]|uniref:serine hydrolase domain-containing protein n=1 Tax=Nocardia sp. NPDC051570 TaxID=3364324 RepID=UPI00379CFD81
MKRVLTVLIGVGMLSGCTPTSGTHDPADRSREVLDRMVAEGLAVGAQIRVTRDGRQYTAVAGRTELDGGQPVPVDGRFRIASVTKLFTVAVMLQLVGEHRVELDAPVNRYLPGLLPADRAAITVRMLLQHSSGLAEFADDNPAIPLVGDEFLRNRLRRVDGQQLAVAAATRQPLLTPIGSRFNYSNTNYVLAGMVIEAVSERRWADEVTDRIIAPLRLIATSIPGDDTEIADPHAHGYALDSNNIPVDVTENDTSWSGAAGSMISTTADLDRFLAALTDGTLLRPAEIAEMTHTRPLNDEDGLGLSVTQTHCGVPVWVKEGSVHGYTTWVFTTLDRTRRAEISFTTRQFPGPVAQERAAFEAIEDAALCG